MQNNRPKTKTTTVSIDINEEPYDIDFFPNYLGPFYALDIKDKHYKYFEKRFLEQMKSELGININKLFGKSDYFNDMYKYYHNIAKGPRYIVV